jgi:hypothetical protein
MKWNFKIVNQNKITMMSLMSMNKVKDLNKTKIMSRIDYQLLLMIRVN